MTSLPKPSKKPPKGNMGEFQKFLLRGNLVELAIGFTVGAAFSTVARSFVDDIIMPPVALLLGGADFSNLFVILKPGTPPPPYNTLESANSAGAVTINYGLFLNSLLSLLVVALAMYSVIKLVNRLENRLEGLTKKEQEEKDKSPENKKCSYCYSTIDFRSTRCPHCTSKLVEPEKI